VRRIRERAGRRRALDRARRMVLRRRQVRAEVLDVFKELLPRERVRALQLKHGLRGWEAQFREVPVWCGGRREEVASAQIQRGR